MPVKQRGNSHMPPKRKEVPIFYTGNIHKAFTPPYNGKCMITIGNCLLLNIIHYPAGTCVADCINLY